jgi:Protein of unknown function, DUF547/Mannosylglycerate hydrolase MGH1-like glycoside hydrolase domain
MPGAEETRLAEDARREKNWKRWGPYLAERQWGTVREDYSDGEHTWQYFPHDDAPHRAYRWGEDGLLGITDRECRLCFALALWNGRDPILKERLFGLSGKEGNHGEDVKEAYFYLDASPTNAYLKALYKYPQGEFPYQRLRDENAKRGYGDREFELVETGAFDEDRYFDVFAEYAKAGPDEMLMRITVANRGPEAATLHLLPTLWFRNTWSWGRVGPEYPPRPRLWAEGGTRIVASHATLGRFALDVEPLEGAGPVLLFTENETNAKKLFGTPNAQPYVKDAFHAAIVDGKRDAVNPAREGTKAAAHFRLTVPAQGSAVVRLKLTPVGGAATDGRIAIERVGDPPPPAAVFGSDFAATFMRRRGETDAYYQERIPATLTDDERRVARQAYAGLVWSKQFYGYVVGEWLDGDPGLPAPDEGHATRRNADWRHVHTRDVISMPDKWEYPWFAAWDLAFHMIPFAKIDPDFARQQLVLLAREWYMHPNGQMPAYEWAFDDVNPPVHAWAAWRVYKMTARRGERDRAFLVRMFHKLLINFTWWVNRKDVAGNNLFAGGFLGLDNIGVFDRSKPLPGGGFLEQADGTAWMAFYCGTMLSIALELADKDRAYEDVASKFFEHYVAISDAMNSFGGTGLWDEADGFYYDQLHHDGQITPVKLRSAVGLIPLLACEVLDQSVIARLPGFTRRMNWFLENRRDLSKHITYMASGANAEHGHRLLAIPSRERLERVLRVMLDEKEFLSPFGIRSLSRAHLEQPFVLDLAGGEYRVGYVPGEADSGLFGGNSNWRGPVWFPLNYLMIEALERYQYFYGDSFRIECPTGSGRMCTLGEVAHELSERLTRLFMDSGNGRPCHGGDARFATDPNWRELVLFHEYFDGDTGRGAGASHQTGWTALIARCLEKHAFARARAAAGAAAGPAKVVTVVLGLALGVGLGALRARATSNAVAAQAVTPSLALAAAPASAAAPARTAAAPAARPVPPPTYDHSAFDAVLKATVHDGLVDYATIRAHYRPALEGYLLEMSHNDPSKLPKPEYLAFLINQYNATMLLAVADSLRPGWGPSANSFGVFDSPLVHTNLGPISLNVLENEVIRRTFREPRVHFALVCAARSCPVLLPRAYVGRDLDATLAANFTRFVRDPSRNKFADSAKKMALSSIFKWYADDFSTMGGVPVAVSRALGRDVTHYQIAYLDYDWSLNIAPGKRTGGR